MTDIPWSISRAVVTPIPATCSPSFQTRRVAQEGLWSLKTAHLAPTMRAIFNVCRAPSINASVTSAPPASITRARPFNTSRPSPPENWAGGRGVGSPPSCSGQTGTNEISFLPKILSDVFSPLSYLQDIPSRQALTSTGPSRWSKGDLSGTENHPSPTPG